MTNMTDGYIYAFRCEGFVKIGYTRRLHKRIRQIRNACPFPVDVAGVWHTDADPRAVESMIHRRLAHLRVRGEWFKNTPGLIDRLEMLVIWGRGHVHLDALIDGCRQLHALQPNEDRFNEAIGNYEKIRAIWDDRAGDEK